MGGIELYRFEDLDKKAQIEALHAEREKVIKTGYLWADECFESLFAYYDLLGIEVTDFNICFWSIEDTFLHTKRKSKYKPVITKEVIQSLRACNGDLTGYCMDRILYAAVNECLYSGEENPNTIARHLYECWIKEARKDAENTLTEEYIHSWFDHIQAWFNEDGKLYTSKF